MDGIDAHVHAPIRIGSEGIAVSVARKQEVLVRLHQGDKRIQVARGNALFLTRVDRFEAGLPKRLFLHIAR